MQRPVARARKEPPVSITRDGEAVADAKVFSSLISADGTEVARQEVATVYEPEENELRRDIPIEVDAD